VTASSTQEAGAEDPVVEGEVALGGCETHPAAPIPATASTAVVSLSSNLVGIIGSG